MQFKVNVEKHRKSHPSIEYEYEETRLLQRLFLNNGTIFLLVTQPLLQQLHIQESLLAPLSKIPGQREYISNYIKTETLHKF